MTCAFYIKMISNHFVIIFMSHSFIQQTFTVAYYVPGATLGVVNEIVSAFMQFIF
jgi:hypothetical protein